MKNKLFAGLATVLFMFGAVGIASANLIYSSYTGSQQGVTVRDMDLNQITYFDTGFDIEGIGAGQNNDMYVTSQNGIYNYSSTGMLLNSMIFPVSGINYTDVSVGASNVFASYTGSQQGVTVRDMDLNQLTAFNIGFDIEGIAAGQNNDMYVTSQNGIYNYSSTGTLLNSMIFPVSGINYTDVSVGASNVFASYTGSQQGVTVRDMELNQLFSFNTGFDIEGIAAGQNNDMYVTSQNGIYNYSSTGTLLNSMIFPDARINYTDITVSERVPEPATMLLFGTGLAGLVGTRIRRRKK